MIVNLYKLTKKINSTLRPAPVTGTEYDCKILNPSSIINPTLELQKTDSNLIYEFNYAYIPTFKRYYFVNDIVSFRNLWRISLTVDVLATYRTDIYNSSQYVLRSRMASNPDIVDPVYPTINSGGLIHVEGETYASDYESSTLSQSGAGQYEIYRRSVMRDTAWSIDRNYFETGINIGAYIIGMVSNNSTGVTYYGTTRTGLVSFLQKVLTYSPSDITDLSTGTAKTLFNGLQYIVSVTWFPALPTKPGSQSYLTSINVGGYPIDVTGLMIFDISENYIEEFYFDLTIPVHPKRYTSTYGVMNWLKLSPYSQYNLYYAPFGNIPLDSTKLFSCSSLRVQWSIDFMTGSSILKLKDSNTGKLIYTTNSTLGVALPISGLTINNLLGLGIVTSYYGLKTIQKNPIVSGINNALQSIDWKSIFGDNWSWNDSAISDILGIKTKSDFSVNNAIDMGVDAMASSLGQMHTVGKPESFLSYFEIPVLYAWFLDIAEVDINRFGRPLNETRTLSNIATGFVKCADSNVLITTVKPTFNEQNQVNSMLNTGIFLE